MTLRPRRPLASVLAATLGAALPVGGCFDAGRGTDARESSAAAGESPVVVGASAISSPTETSSAGPSLIVIGRGSALCPTPPDGCLIGFLIGSPNVAVPVTWEPSLADPSFDLTMTGTGATNPA